MSAHGSLAQSEAERKLTEIFRALREAREKSGHRPSACLQTPFLTVLSLELSRRGLSHDGALTFATPSLWQEGQHGNSRGRA